MDYQNLLSSLSAVSLGQIIAIDGPAGSGKTTLANKLATDIANVEVIHVDDLYQGWSDAFSTRLTASVISQILLPISQKIDFNYEIYDWQKNVFYKSKNVPKDKIYILEGVGAAQTQFRPYLSKIIWLNISDEIGLSRVLQRDGAGILSPMQQFQQEQKQHFARDLTEKAADFSYEGVPKTTL
jgi:uridine kinase